MMKKISKEEIINDIATVIREPFEKRGFAQKRKRFFECEDDHRNVLQYEISLSTLKGYFSMHLRLNILNKPLLKEINLILGKALHDAEYPYHESWSPEFIKKTISERIRNYFLFGLTDWRVFKRNDETLEDFNNRFSVWFCNFDSIDDIEKFEIQLLDSVEYAVEWFSTVLKSNNWIIENTDYPALYFLKKQGDFDGLSKKYNELLSKHRVKKEAELFYKYLMES